MNYWHGRDNQWRPGYMALVSLNDKKLISDKVEVRYRVYEHKFYIDRHVALTATVSGDAYVKVFDLNDIPLFAIPGVFRTTPGTVIEYTPN